jgi:hypothetical protein
MTDLECKVGNCVHYYSVSTLKNSVHQTESWKKSVFPQQTQKNFIRTLMAPSSDFSAAHTYSTHTLAGGPSVLGGPRFWAPPAPTQGRACGEMP